MLHLRDRRKASWLRHEAEMGEFQEVESEKSQGDQGWDFPVIADTTGRFLSEQIILEVASSPGQACRRECSH